ncbi:MAG: hypothetical protein A2167_05480 [Planctomycetes bacterium RBG_13_46_10]|nr:MAG: hypothetical protein A2167_05480 [Planctomycetes bacterium RBG_13_46_10]
MQKGLIVLWISVILFVSMTGGCDPGEYEAAMLKVDTVAADINNVSNAVQQGVQSPAGLLIPEPYRTGVSLVTYLLTAVVGAYTQYRLKTKPLQAITKSIVQGIQNTNDAAADQAKKNIKAEMINNGILAEGNVLVEQLKKSVTSPG